MSTVGQPPHLVLRGYEAKDYLDKNSHKKTEKTDYAQWIVPAWRGLMLDTKQRPGDDCAYFEDHFLSCMEAFGAKLGRLYCDLEHRDLQECVQHDKKIKRFNTIRDVRFRKWLRGEIPHIYEPLDDYLKSVHGAPTAFVTGNASK